MILYTEQQLVEAYRNYVGSLKDTASKVTIPTLKQFRKIYEEYWEHYYEQEGRTDT